MFVYSLSTIFFYLTYSGLDLYFPDYFPDSSNIVTRKYRIANSVKSAALLLLCIPGTQFLYNLTFYPDENQWNRLNMLGSVYAATDAAALVYNPNCHTSTIAHHIVVQFFYYYCYWMNFNMYQGAARAIGVYCVLSSYAYLVNFRLSVRFIPYKQFEYYINETALYIYIASCLINWIIQSYFLLGGLNMYLVERIIYVGTLGMTINDDLFLIKFLRKIDYKKAIE